MGILGSIFSKIFPSSHSANAPSAAPQAGPGTVPAASGQPTPTSSPVTQTPAMAQVDVIQVLDGMAAKSAEKLNWKTSIVDLMKLLQLDSSLTARKELAQELKYTGDPNDSATMNIWLHRQVMTKLAASGGKVPPEMKD